MGRVDGLGLGLETRALGVRFWCRWGKLQSLEGGGLPPRSSLSSRIRHLDKSNDHGSRYSAHLLSSECCRLFQALSWLATTDLNRIGSAIAELLIQF